MPAEIVCADALEWLPTAPGGAAVVTSPPDAEEIGLPVDQWEPWFRRALAACFAAGSPVVLYVTDRLADGRRASKAGLALDEARKAGRSLIWHKVALRRGVGKVDLRRPGFSHMLAFGGFDEKAGEVTPDVVERGAMLYPNATGLIAARLMAEFALRHAGTVVDPFCGQGTIPAVVSALGGNAIGVDIDPDQCAKARALKLRLG